MMPTLYYHELQSYRTESERRQRDVREIAKPDAVPNLTHSAFGVSNRANYMVVGLCSLVERRLWELAQAADSPIKLADVRGQGICRLKLFLSRLHIVDFGTLKRWDAFQSVYKIRNSIVHSYGGMLVDEPDKDLVEHLSKLNLTNILVGGCRIRVDSYAFEIILDIVDSLLSELGAYDETET